MDHRSDPDSPWHAAMLEGDLEAAWRETDRVEIPRRLAEQLGRPPPASAVLRWNGTPFAGRRVLISCEHGLGDTIQFIRYVRRLRAARAARVMARVQPALLGLLRDLPGLDGLLDAWTPQPEPDHDVAIECMELAYAFRSTLQTIPPSLLPMRSLRLAARRFDLGPSGLPRIGLLWAASAWDPSRSIALQQLAPLQSVRDVHFFSLQQGPEAGEAPDAPFPLESLSHRTGEIVDAAAAMLAMDLIITVDGMPAHLAGSLRRPTWLLLPHQADWRWMRDRQESPWYPTMRLFRQPSPGNWSSPIEAIARGLKDVFPQR